MRNKFILTVSLMLIIALGFHGQHWVAKTTTSQAKIQNSRMVPTIFVPGSEATINRFDDLFATINAKGAPHSVLKVQVSTSGQLTFLGSINANDRQPFIVIGFEDNQDGYDHIKKQASWLAKALDTLQDRYHFQTFSAVGHSNGGLDWTIYLEKYHADDDFNIPILMTLGTPFNFSESSLQRRTEMLNDLISGNNQLPKDLTMYSVAGTEDYTDDGIVPVQSVIAGKYIYQKAVKSYTQITVSGDNAQHSSLPENPEVVSLIESNILKPLARSDRKQ